MFNQSNISDLNEQSTSPSRLPHNYNFNPISGAGVGGDIGAGGQTLVGKRSFNSLIDSASQASGGSSSVSGGGGGVIVGGVGLGGGDQELSASGLWVSSPGFDREKSEGNPTPPSPST
jgi:hypothetical protein